MEERRYSKLGDGPDFANWKMVQHKETQDVTQTGQSHTIQETADAAVATAAAALSGKLTVGSVRYSADAVDASYER